jgi:hypothetical protein
VTSPDEFALRRGDPPRRRRSRASVADLGGLALVVAVLATALPAWARSSGGRELLARQIEQLLDGEIRGHVTIGSLDRVDATGVAATDVRFFDESGRVVIEADDVELEIDWDELMAGHFVSPRGHAHGGRVIMETLASGELLIDRAFESAHPGPPGSPIGPDVVRLERLAVSGVEVLIDLHGAREIRASRMAAILLVRAPENGSARMRADRIDARLHLDAPIPQDLAIEDGHFELDGAARRRARLDFPTHVGGEPLHVEAVVRADAQENMHVEVTLTPESVGAVLTSGPLIAQALILETMSDAIDVTVELP